MNIFNLSDNILISTSQWKNHVLRIEDKLIINEILTNKPIRRRNIGRPQ
jgi:hypothetical protein